MRAIEPVPKASRSFWPVALLVLVGIVIEFEILRWAGARYRNDGVDQVALATLPVWLAIGVRLLWNYGLRAVPLVLVTFVMLGGGWALISLANSTRTSTIRAHCANNLRQIGQALRIYHEKHGSFPPAYVASPSGMPMHSWRTLILPYMEQTPTYLGYDFHEPWDGPHNQARCEHPIWSYRCPWSRVMHNSATTSFVAVVGPHTAWPGPTGSKLEDFKDGPENTILVVEVADSRIPWAEPHDLCVGQMPVSPGPPGPSGSHPRGGFNALFADGTVRYLRADLDAATYWALLSRDGGEKVRPVDCEVLFPPNSH